MEVYLAYGRVYLATSSGRKGSRPGLRLGRVGTSREAVDRPVYQTSVAQEDLCPEAHGG